MKDTKKIFIAIAPVIALAGLVYFISRKKIKYTNYLKKEQIAEEGYETAADILFPLRSQSAKYRTNWD